MQEAVRAELRRQAPLDEMEISVELTPFRPGHPRSWPLCICLFPWDDERLPRAHISSKDVSPVAVAQEIHRMTVDEYVRIVRDFGWESTELVDGVVYDVSPEYNRHAGTVMDLLDKLRDAFPDDVVRVVGSVHVGPISMFDPDVYAIAGSFAQDPDWAIPASAVKLVA